MVVAVDEQRLLSGRMLRISLLAAVFVVVTSCSLKSSLLSLTPEAAGEHCAAGGTRIESGLDANGNGALDGSEVSSTSYVCNGGAGATGESGTSCTVAENAGVKTISCGSGTQVTISDGAKGDPGDQGPAGMNGADGASCSAADNGDGTVTFTCGATMVTVSLGSSSGGSAHNSLIAMTADTTGTCATGGTQVQSGLDVNDNDTLDAGEVVSTQYVCNGANGANGATGDAGANGTNGSDGHDSLVNLSADSTTCATGGTKIEAGIDLDDNGTLSAGEVLNTRYVCNGATGATGSQGTPGATGAAGAAGKNSLISITNEASGSNCATGGKKLQVGVDANSNGTLDSGEVTSTQYVCNGAAASNSVYGTGQDGALSISSTTNWVTSPPSGSLQYTNITVSAPWTIPTGLKLRATGTITIATGGSITVAPGTVIDNGIASSAPQALVSTAGAMYGGTGCTAAFARQLFNPGRFGGGSGNGSVNGTITFGGGGGTVVMLAGGAVSLASGTVINAAGAPGLQGNASANSGGGGGGGVIVVLSNTSITNAGTLNASGGKGADTLASPDSSGGGGGGGGLIQLAAPSITNTGTLNVSAGAGGSGSSQGGYAAGGGASVGNGGGSGGSGVPTASAGTAGLSFTTTTTDPAALFLSSSQP